MVNLCRYTTRAPQNLACRIGGRGSLPGAAGAAPPPSPVALALAPVGGSVNEERLASLSARAPASEICEGEGQREGLQTERRVWYLPYLELVFLSARRRVCPVL